MSDERLEWVRPPQQARSQQTLERLLDAAEQLVDERGIEGITVAEVARRAGSSVGAFYSRFSDKDALVRTMFQRFHEQALATAELAFEAGRWADTPLDRMLETMVSFMLKVLQQRRQLIAALVQRASRDAELDALGHHLHERLTTKLLALLAQRGTAIAHPQPEEAVGMAVWMVLSLMESRALLGPHDELPVNEGAVGREVALMVTRYLGLEEAVASGRGRTLEGGR